MINWKTLGILYFAIFSSLLGQGIIIPVLPVYANTLGATAFHIGLIFGAYSLSMSIFFPYIGRLSDLKGRKPFIVYGLLFYSLLSIAFIVAADVYSLTLIRFFQGIGATMIMPVAQAYAGEITPPGKEGTAMGLLGVAVVAALGLGPLLGGITQDTFGMQLSFICLCVISFLSFIMCSAFLPSVKDERKKAREPVIYKELLSDKHIGGLFLFRITYTLCIGTVWAFAPMLAQKEYELSGLDIGIVICLGVFASGSLMVPMGIVADKFNKRILILIGGLISSGALFLLTQAHQVSQLYLFSILMGIGDGIAAPAIMAMTVVLGRKKHSMGTVVSLLSMTEPLGMLIGPIMSGAFITILGMTATFGGISILMLLATVLTFFFTADFHAFETVCSKA